MSPLYFVVCDTLLFNHVHWYINKKGGAPGRVPRVSWDHKSLSRDFNPCCPSLVWPDSSSKTNPPSARAISKLKHYSEQTKYYLHVTSFARNWLPARCFPPSHWLPCLIEALWLVVVNLTPVKVSLGKVHPFPLITGNPNELSSLTPSLGRHLQLASNFTLDSN